MYIIEKIIKLVIKFRKREEDIILPNNENNPELEDILTCNHTFMPIDSTKEILACSKCGYVVSKKRASKGSS